MIGRPWTAASETPFASLLPGIEPFPGDFPAGLGSIGSATLHCLALIALAMLLILVVLPAALDAAASQAVAAV